MEGDKVLMLYLICGIVMITSGFSIEGERTGDGREKRQVESKNVWPRNIVYTISNILSIHNKPMEAISSAIAHWEARTCIKFTYIPEAELADSGIIGTQQYISFDGAPACSSPVGMWQGRGPHSIKISRNSCAYTGMVIHEIGHALGMWHEHARSDRDAHVLILWNNIESRSKHNFYKQRHSELIVPYDLESIMHYDRKMFSANGQPTLETLDRRLNGIVGRHEVLSHYDMMTTNQLYQCADQCDPDLECENDGFLTSECTCQCPHDLVGERCELVDTSLECGGVVDVTDYDVTVTSPNFPSRYKNNQKCVWLFKGPPQTLLRLQVKEMDTEASPIKNRCRDELEVRYHSIGVSKGHMMCGKNISNGIHDSVDNKIMLRFESDSEVTGRGFRAVVSVRPAKDCFSSPCQNGGVCEELPSIKTYLCDCPDGWVGKDCEVPIVDGKLSAWSSWSECESSCGMQSQYRTCTDPPPQNGGKDCTGTTYRTRRCHEAPDCDSYFWCNFGSSIKGSDSCGITRDTAAGSLQWLPNSGKTPSDKTGPLGGHTNGDRNDYYYYLEASVGRKEQKAVSWIPQMKLKPAVYCLEFYYSLHGGHIGTLSVIQKFIHKPGLHNTLWQRSGEQGQDWGKGMITVLMHKNMQLGFMAVRGDTYQGDIGIDDISLSPGECRPIKKKTYKGCKVEKKRAKSGNFEMERNCVISKCFCNQDGYVDCPPWGKETGCKGSKSSKWRRKSSGRKYGYSKYKRTSWMAKWRRLRKRA